jgi:hypothetical protein
MKNIITIFALTILFSGCLEDHSDLIPDRALDGDPSGAVIDAYVLEVDEGVLSLMLDVFVVNGQGNFVSGLSGTNFNVENVESISLSFGDSISFTNVSVGASRTERKGSYSATLLLDQSGSISDTDPNNTRVEAAKIFSGALGNNDYALVSSFQQDDVTIHTGYMQDTAVLFQSLDDLLFQQEGQTPLYSSVSRMVEYTRENAPGNNHAIILFTDGIQEPELSDEARVLKELTDFASSQDVEIYTIGLSRNVNFSVLSSMATNTGGAFMWAEDTRQLITMFGTLGDLLSGNALYYQTQWQAIISSGTWQSGQSYVGEVVITLSDGSQFIVPFEFVVP